MVRAGLCSSQDRRGKDEQTPDSSPHHADLPHSVNVMDSGRTADALNHTREDTRRFSVGTRLCTADVTPSREPDVTAQGVYAWVGPSSTPASNGVPRQGFGLGFMHRRSAG